MELLEECKNQKSFKKNVISFLLSTEEKILIYETTDPVLGSLQINDAVNAHLNNEDNTLQPVSSYLGKKITLLYWKELVNFNQINCDASISTNLLVILFNNESDNIEDGKQAVHNILLSLLEPLKKVVFISSEKKLFDSCIPKFLNKSIKVIDESYTDYEYTSNDGNNVAMPTEFYNENNTEFMTFIEDNKNNKFEQNVSNLSVENFINSVKYGISSLFFETWRGAVNIVEGLLVQGAEIVTEGHFQSSPLHEASESGDLDVVKALLKHGVSVNSRDNVGKTPLHTAAENGHKNIFRALLNAKADLTLKSNLKNWTVLHYAAWKGQDQIVDEVFNIQDNINANIDINFQDNRGQTALMLAAYWGHTHVLNTLLNYKAKVDIKDDDGQTALILAAYWGHLEVVKSLLLYKADVNIQDKEGRTALHYSIINRRGQVTEVLLANNANRLLRDEFYKSASDYEVYNSSNKEVSKMTLANNFYLGNFKS